MGISLGKVNFAVRSAFISDESRPGEGGETIYSNTEIMQMLGRKGRGVVAMTNKGFLFGLIWKISIQKQKSVKMQSSLKFDPTTIT